MKKKGIFLLKILFVSKDLCHTTMRHLKMKQEEVTLTLEGNAV